MSHTEKAIFAAGCFWGVEDGFRKIAGVIDAVSGYIGGTTDNPTYKEVCSGNTGHAEAVEVTFDPAKVSYDQLLDHFWTSHNPTQVNRQGPDFGTQYRTGIFTTNEDQVALATASRTKIQERFSKPIATTIEPAPTFWKAEEYHQRYFEKNGGGHCAI